MMLIPCFAFAGAMKWWGQAERVDPLDLNKDFRHLENTVVGGHGPRLVDEDISPAAAIATSKLADRYLIPFAWGIATSCGTCPSTCTLNPASHNVASVCWTGPTSGTSLGTKITFLTSLPNTFHTVVFATEENQGAVPSGPIGYACGQSFGAITSTTLNVYCAAMYNQAAAPIDLYFVVYSAP